MSEIEHVPPEVLRTLFLFESLDDDKLAWLSEQGRVQAVPAGESVFEEGDPATCFYVMLSGTITLSRLVQGVDVEVTRTDYAGSYSGATQAYLEQDDPRYTNAMRAVTDCRFFVLPATEFGTIMRTWFPMAMHMLQGLFLGLRRSNAVVGERQRLLALGQLSAGLTHELNNPAAAAVRAASSLRERIAGMRHKLTIIAAGQVSPEAIAMLTEFQEEAIAHLPDAPDLTPLQVSDREDELGDWLDEREVVGAWNLATTFTAAGLGIEWVERVEAKVPAGLFGNGLAWISYALETEMLMNEIHDATTRVSTLVNAAKQYSQMDRAEHQWIDVHEGIYSTMTMLKPKWGPGITIVKDVDRSLPKIPAYPAELNQVWTNIIDNAVQAMKGEGTLSIRTASEGECLLVEIGDTGPGIPPEVKQRIFEPFFTTKPVGEGTGLGLDITWRVIVQRHGGDIQVESVPGDTRFRVLLPLHEPPVVPDPD